MKCPICSAEMADGYVPIIQERLYFVPNKGGEPARNIYSYGVNTIPLTKFPKWHLEKAEGFYCSTCNIVILPVKDLGIK